MIAESDEAPTIDARHRARFSFLALVLVVSLTFWWWGTRDKLLEGVPCASLPAADVDIRQCDHEPANAAPNCSREEDRTRSDECITVSVIDGAGSPVAGASVEVRDALDGRLDFEPNDPRLSEERATAQQAPVPAITDEAGLVRINWQWAEIKDVEIHATSGRLRGLRRISTAANPRKVYSLMLIAEISIPVQVLNAMGKPLRDVEVYITAGLRAPSGRLLDPIAIRTSHTDINGMTVFRDAQAWLPDVVALGHETREFFVCARLPGHNLSCALDADHLTDRVTTLHMPPTGMVEFTVASRARCLAWPCEIALTTDGADDDPSLICIAKGAQSIVVDVALGKCWTATVVGHATPPIIFNGPKNVGERLKIVLPVDKEPMITGRLTVGGEPLCNSRCWLRGRGARTCLTTDDCGRFSLRIGASLRRDGVSRVGIEYVDRAGVMHAAASKEVNLVCEDGCDIGDIELEDIRSLPCLVSGRVISTEALERVRLHLRDCDGDACFFRYSTLAPDGRFNIYGDAGNGRVDMEIEAPEHLGVPRQHFRVGQHDVVVVLKHGFAVVAEFVDVERRAAVCLSIGLRRRQMEQEATGVAPYRVVWGANRTYRCEWLLGEGGVYDLEVMLQGSASPLVTIRNIGVTEKGAYDGRLHGIVLPRFRVLRVRPSLQKTEKFDDTNCVVDVLTRGILVGHGVYDGNGEFLVATQNPIDLRLRAVGCRAHVTTSVFEDVIVPLQAGPRVVLSCVMPEAATYDYAEAYLCAESADGPSEQIVGRLRKGVADIAVPGPGWYVVTGAIWAGHVCTALSANPHRVFVDEKCESFTVRFGVR
jgi:hypothetical protein